MSKKDAKLVKVQALSDQGWTELSECKDAIDRIAEHGPVVDGKRDWDMVRKVFLIVSGELRLRAAKIHNAEESQP